MGKLQDLNGVVEGPLIKFIKAILKNVLNSWDISDESLDYILTNNPKIDRFFLFLKNHERIHDIHRRPVLSNSS